MNENPENNQQIVQVNVNNNQQLAKILMQMWEYIINKANFKDKCKYHTRKVN